MGEEKNREKNISRVRSFYELNKLPLIYLKKKFYDYLKKLSL